MVAMTIIEFLAARLSEDEAAAVRAARPEPWVKPQPARPNWYVQFWADEKDRAAVIADPESSAYPIVATLGYDGDDEADEDLAEGRVEHIARHDPARVLAEVAAKRRILARHSDGHGCPVCLIEMDVEEGPDGNGHGYPVMHWAEPCETVRDLAAPYADHPDYDPAWRVQ